MSIKFTGGNSLTKEDDGLAFYLHKLMMLNELRGGYGAYQLSNAKNAASGLTFGGIQRDISCSHNQKTFENILIQAKILTPHEINLIKNHLYKQCNKFNEQDNKVYLELKSKINQSLSSKQGIEIINRDYVNEIHKKAQQVEVAVSNIKNTDIKHKIENNIAAKLIIADTFNQFGSADKRGYTVPNQLLKLLSAEKNTSIDIPFSNRVFKVGNDIDINDLIDFKLSTNYGQKYPKDTMRRIHNIQDITNKYSTKDNLIKDITVLDKDNIDESLKLKDVENMQSALNLQEKINNKVNIKSSYNYSTQKLSSMEFMEESIKADNTNKKQNIEQNNLNNSWAPLPINIKNTDKRYIKLEKFIAQALPEFNGLDFAQQDKIIREYINIKNTEYAKNLKQEMDNIENSNYQNINLEQEQAKGKSR